MVDIVRTLAEGLVVLIEDMLDEYGTAASGNWGHAGIPGSVGGSAPGGGRVGVAAASAKEVATLSESVEIGLSWDKDGNELPPVRGTA